MTNINNVYNVNNVNNIKTIEECNIQRENIDDKSNNLINTIISSIQSNLHKNTTSVYIMKINDQNLFVINNKQEAKYCIKQFVSFLLKNLFITDFDLFVDNNYNHISFTINNNTYRCTKSETYIHNVYNVYYEKIDMYNMVEITNGEKFIKSNNDYKSIIFQFMKRLLNIII